MVRPFTVLYFFAFCDDSYLTSCKKIIIMTNLFFSIFSRFSRTSLLCKTHRSFCDHLDFSFYKDELDGASRLLLALCILETSIPRMESPPYDLVGGMEKYGFDKNLKPFRLKD